MKEDVIDSVALSCCLRTCENDKGERQAFLEAFERADDRARYHMLQRERQMLLHAIHEKEEAIGQIDYMLHLLVQKHA